MHTPMHRDDWEDWTDEEAVAPKRDTRPLVHLGSTPLGTSPTSPSTSSAHTTSRRSRPRQSNPKIQRLKSRKRQKFQNEKLGISLVTDMTRFRTGPHHVAQLVKPELATVSSVEALKFVDASALRALEGSPSSASMGNWAWLNSSKKNQSPVAATPDTFHPSPEGDKIVIGIAMPEQDAAGRTISPQTATIATPASRLPQTSAWSPDTEDGLSPAARFLQNQPGIYAQSTGQSAVPPVPAVPAVHKNLAKARLSREIDVDDDFDFTPVTLFEEDGRRSPTSAVSKISPETARSRSGWWDHVKTPFKERFSPTSKLDRDATSSDEWWKSADEKKGRHMPQQYAASEASSSTLRPIVPIIRQPSPTMASSSRSISSVQESQQEPRSGKAHVAMDEHGDEDGELGELPPPYERTPSSKQQAEAIRYRALFPAGHHLAGHFPPTPQPSNEKMSSSFQKLSDVPLTPAASPPGTATTEEREAPLPDRVAGTYAGDQFADVRADDSPAAKVEKARRRHEKEDVLARRAGGFWKGRGCVPENGCYGRSGREGRQRRRVWLLVCLAFWVLTILGVVLGVVLSRKLQDRAQGAGAGSATASGSSSATPSSGSGTSGSDISDKASSVWLNLTSYPAIPTGLATVVGPDNSQAVSGCVSPATLWSCSLPPEQQAANEPNEPNQPTFIFQIQYDNSTRQLWNIPNGAAPTPLTASSAAVAATTTPKKSSTTTSATSATATNDLQELSFVSRRDGSTTLYDAGISPSPEPPSFDDMWFLGNWTDGIVSANKSGEPTPFYISFFTTLNGSAGPNMLTGSSADKTRRDGVSDLLPDAPLDADGTGAAAQLRPFPVQQPLRLYDRGLPTEHYGCYTYFNKTIYVTSVNASTAAPSSDEGGGVLEGSADWYAVWTQTRFVVKIWTRRSNGGGARLIGGSGGNTTTPGSFPYPVTLGEDTHGGDLQLKQAFAYGVEADRSINETKWSIIDNNIGYGSAVVNAAQPDGDLSWGGTDGGTGGCKCEWVNWVNDDGNVDTSFG